MSRREGSLEIRQTIADAAPVAILEGRLPTERELRRMRRKGYGLHLSGLPSGTDLSWLAGLEWLGHLEVFGVSTDTSFVEQMHALRSLTLLCADAPTLDLSGLASLETFSGGGECASVLENGHVRHVTLQDTRQGVLPPIADNIETLELSMVTHVDELHPASALPRLRWLSIYVSRRFDAGSLSPFGALREVFLQRVRSLVHTEALVQLHLTTLALDGVQQLDSPRSLGALRQGTLVVVSGSSRSALRPVAAQSEADWTFRPQ